MFSVAAAQVPQADIQNLNTQIRAWPHGESLWLKHGEAYLLCPPTVYSERHPATCIFWPMALSKETAYTMEYPPEKLKKFQEHFSSLLLSGDLSLTLLELGSLGCFSGDTCLVDTYLEAVWSHIPSIYYTKCSESMLLKSKKDLCGRDMKELETILHHDRLTLISQFAFNVGLYYAIPGYYPAEEVVAPLHERALRVVANHYLLSFGMYWMHRALHVVPWLWEKIHSYHHWAKHPLSRNTYDDHWLDNLGNAVIGHFCAQVLLPLDRSTFWFFRLIRILESLEKHSGVSCSSNLAHQLQRFLPFAQMHITMIGTMKAIRAATIPSLPLEVCGIAFLELARLVEHQKLCHPRLLIWTKCRERRRVAHVASWIIRLLFWHPFFL